jgi:murein DD-endopeptidase MepM/ murein hydrolase activator NlpD
MEEKQTFSQRINSFLSGKGFYVVLLVCLATVSVSAYLLIHNGSESFRGGYDADPTDISQPAPNPTPTPPIFAPPDSGGDGTSGGVPAAPPSPPEQSGQRTQGSPPLTDAADNTNPTQVNGESTAANDAPADAAAMVTGEREAADESAARPSEFAWPLAGEIIIPYTADELAYNRTMGDWRVHRAVDISAALGTKVTSVADGEVSAIFEDDLLGTTVIVAHGDGLDSRYSNLAAAPAVNVGDKIALGAVIGSVGDTALGESGEPTHLHFAMTEDGSAVNPLNYLPKRP